MSDRLAISSALSVLMMAGYVLFGGQAREAEFGPQAGLLPGISAPSGLPQAAVLLGR